MVTFMMLFLFVACPTIGAKTAKWGGRARRQSISASDAGVPAGGSSRETLEGGAQVSPVRRSVDTVSPARHSAFLGTMEVSQYVDEFRGKRNSVCWPSCGTA
jgi:hypothetical protein